MLEFLMGFVVGAALAWALVVFFILPYDEEDDFHSY